MIAMLLAAILATEASMAATACTMVDEPETGHLLDVCDPLIQGDKAYSVTFQASLNPQPAAQQVALYEMDGEWFLWVAGFRWERGTSLVTTRRNDLPISRTDAQSLVALLNEAATQRMSKLSHYGDAAAVCADGATIAIAMASRGQLRRFAQHSCAGKSELNEIAAAFRQKALKYDAGFEGMLTGLRN